MMKKVLKKMMAFGLGICMILAYCPLYAEETEAARLAREEKEWQTLCTAVSAGTGDVTIDLSSLSANANSTITIPEAVTSISITGDPAKTYSKLTISLASRNKNLMMNINDLNIGNVEVKDGNPIGETCIDINNNTAITTISFSGKNKLISNAANGIAVYDGASLILESKNGNADELNIEAGNNAAGIGGRYYTGAGAVKKGNGNITINSGTIIAKGGEGSAAIGTANDPDTGKFGDITINGGDITATGGTNAAGIGQGKKANLTTGTITINGGKVTATGGSGGAGIGSGIECDHTSNIIIKGTKESTIVTATGKDGGAGIGGGMKCDAGDIDIYGGMIEATGSNAGGKGSAGIGGGSERGFNKITLGETCEMKNEPYIKHIIAGSGAAGIGTGCQGSSSLLEEIFMNSGIVEYIETSGGAAGIGGGYQRGIGLIEVGYTRLEKVTSQGQGGAAVGTGAEGRKNNDKIIFKKECAVYLDSGNKIYNCIGGGKDRDTKDIQVEINGDVFLANDKINVGTTIAEGMKKYKFECVNVSKDALGNDVVTKLAGIKFRVKSTKDANLKLAPEADEDGRIAAIMEDFGSTLSSKGGYYYEWVNAAGEVHYANEYKRFTEGDWQVIQITFDKANSPKSTPAVAAGADNKIVPFSYSNLEFISTINKNASAIKADKIQNVVAKVNFKAVAGEVAPFVIDLNKMAYEIYIKDESSGKFVLNSDLTKKLNDNKSTKVTMAAGSTDTIEIKYPDEMCKDEIAAYKTYKIRILIPSTLDSSVKIKDYYSNRVETADTADQFKETDVSISYEASACSIFWGKEIWGPFQPKVLNPPVKVMVRYWYLTKIH